MIEYNIGIAALLSLIIGFAFIVIFNKRMYWVAKEADDDIFTFAVMLFLAWYLLGEPPLLLSIQPYFYTSFSETLYSKSNLK